MTLGCVAGGGGATHFWKFFVDCEITSRAITKHVVNVGSFRSPLKGKRKDCQDCRSGCIISKYILFLYSYFTLFHLSLY